MRLKPKIKITLYLLLSFSLLMIYFFFRRVQSEYNSILSYEDCIDAGYPMIATYPEKCKIPGKTFINTTQQARTDIVKMTSFTKVKNYRNAYYLIEGEQTTLTHETNKEDSSLLSTSTKTTRYLGNEVRGDFDSNGTEDIAFLITNNRDGNNAFFYLVVALSDKDHTYTGTNAILIGEEIIPKSTELKNNEIIINYLEREPNTSLSTAPNVSISRHFKILNNSLLETSE